MRFTGRGWSRQSQDIVQGANHEGTFKRTWWQLVPRTLVTCSRPRPFQYSSCTTRERKSSRPPETAVPVLKLSYTRERKSSRPLKLYYHGERKSRRLPATAVPVLTLYYHRTAVPVLKLSYTRERKSSRPLKLYYQNENPDGRRPRPFQYSSCTTRERSSRPPETAVPVLNQY